MKKLMIISLLFFVFLLSSCNNQKVLKIATTTSLDNSGLLDYLIPYFEEEYGIDVDIIAVGTGAALELGELGQVEILLVHDYEREIAFVEHGYGEKRANIMYNDFIIIGPTVLSSTTLEDALFEIKENYDFYSRGDQSGTHSKEVSLWNMYGYDVSTFTDFYHETGQGMGTTISMSNLSGFFTLTDRATYLSMLEDISLVIAYENTEELKNQYGVIKINPDLYTGTDRYAELFYNWIQREDVQTLIEQFKQYETQLFYID